MAACGFPQLVSIHHLNSDEWAFSTPFKELQRAILAVEGEVFDLNLTIHSQHFLWNPHYSTIVVDNGFWLGEVVVLLWNHLRCSNVRNPQLLSVNSQFLSQQWNIQMDE